MPGAQTPSVQHGSPPNGAGTRHDQKPPRPDAGQPAGTAEETAALLLLGALALGCLVTALAKRRELVGLVSLIWRDYRSIVWCFVGLVALAVALGLYANGLPGPTDGFLRTSASSVFASLVENLVFFSLLGFGLLVVQRREADRNRSLDDKIDLLFNAKNFRAGEIAFLREQLKQISADCRTVDVEIDVLNHDPTGHFVQIDVSRTWLIANYLADESAVYEWKLKLSADEAPGHTPSMTVYPTFTTTLVAAGDGRWRSTSDDETLHAGTDLPGGASMEVPVRPLEIEASGAREFRTRFRGWQRIYAIGPVPSGAAVGPVLARPDHFKFNVIKHWDEVRVTIRNSLKTPLAVAISQSTGDEGMRMVRKATLEPGDRQRDAHSFENLPARSRVYVSFEPR